MEKGLLPREKRIYTEHNLLISHIFKIINLSKYIVCLKTDNLNKITTVTKK